MLLWTQAHLFPVRDPVGNVERVVLTHEDVTERRAARVAHQRIVGLQELTEGLSQASTTDEMSAVIVAHASKALGADGVAILRELADDEHLEMLDASGMAERVREKWTYVRLNSPLPSSDVARTRAPLFMDSREVMLAHYPHLAAAIVDVGHHASATLPLMVRDRFLGVLSAVFKTSQKFDAETRATAVTVAGLCAQALERARLYDAAVANGPHS